MEDSYEPEYYRIAAYQETNDITNAYHEAGQTTIKFNCKPQRYLKSGDETITFTSTGSLINPTFFSARPIIKVYGSGKLPCYLYESIIEDVHNQISTAAKNEVSTVVSEYQRQCQEAEESKETKQETKTK